METSPHTAKCHIEFKSPNSKHYPVKSEFLKYRAGVNRILHILLVDRTSNLSLSRMRWIPFLVISNDWQSIKRNCKQLHDENIILIWPICCISESNIAPDFVKQRDDLKCFIKFSACQHFLLKSLVAIIFNLHSKALGGPYTSEFLTIKTTINNRPTFLLKEFLHLFLYSC